MNKSQEKTRQRPWGRRRWVAWTGGTVVLLAVMALATVEYEARNAEPILRKRVVDTLTARFHSPVELDALHLSVSHGLAVTGEGLRILYLAGPTEPSLASRGTPMLSVRSFQFHMGLPGLWRPASRVVTVYVQGMRLDIPPGKDRGQVLAGKGGKKAQPRIGITVDQIECADTVLLLETDKPGRPPLEFDIQNLTLKDMGNAQPFQYDATLVNPKPLGNIHSTGHFGPWNDADPRETPVDGDFSFTHADLSTIKGIGGMLSSVGRFSGPLQELTVDGETDTPDFRVDTGNHAVPLHTEFHAIVDGTTGDTTLAPVRAKLLRSSFTASGTIMRVTQSDGHKGHDIALDVVMDGARIEDMLQLGVKTEPPLMRGGLAMRAKIHIPPGNSSVSKKLHLDGTFTIGGATFSNPKVQQKVDSLSMRAQGEPEKANPQDATLATSTMTGHFVLGNAMTTITGLHYQVPGALILMDGQYSLNGETFDFHGVVRTTATASQMTTGWKSKLLKPVDRFLKKNGAGMEIPVKITGTKSDPQFGLDFGRKQNVPAGIPKP